MSKPRAPKEKIKSPESLRRILLRHRGPRAKTVFTNGVFDVLHRGHVTYLFQARSLGSVLIVALNSDDSVKRLKGPKRPYHTLEDRLFTVASLESVDYVTYFDEDTPLELIKLLKPKILVKGGDYDVAKIVGGAEVIANGGVVKTLPFVDGHSTTKILNANQSES